MTYENNEWRRMCSWFLCQKDGGMFTLLNPHICGEIYHLHLNIQDANSWDTLGKHRFRGVRHGVRHVIQIFSWQNAILEVRSQFTLTYLENHNCIMLLYNTSWKIIGKEMSWLAKHSKPIKPFHSMCGITTLWNCECHWTSFSLVQLDLFTLLWVLRHC